ADGKHVAVGIDRDSESLRAKRNRADVKGFPPDKVAVGVQLGNERATGAGYRVSAGLRIELDRAGEATRRVDVSLGVDSDPARGMDAAVRSDADRTGQRVSPVDRAVVGIQL